MKKLCLHLTCNWNDKRTTLQPSRDFGNTLKHVCIAPEDFAVKSLPSLSLPKKIWKHSSIMLSLINGTYFHINRCLKYLDIFHVMINIMVYIIDFGT